MDFKYKEVNKAPVVWSDNFFNEDEVNLIHNECHRLNTLGILQAETGGAYVEKTNIKTGKVEQEHLSKNNGCFLEKVFASEMRLCDTVDIFRNKIHRSKQFHDMMAEMHPYFVTLKQNSGTSTLLSYYDSADHYKGHRDGSFVTVLFWFYNEPKSFTGGDFVIENELTISCKRGRVVFMPGFLLHEVTPIQMKEEDQGKTRGRYTVSQFIGR